MTDKPLRVEIAVTTQHDAWSVNENVRLGAAWLVRDAKNEIRCFSTTCPHLGCAIDFDAKLDKFKCPCHSSTFDKDGLKLSGPALRGMDPLKTEVDAQGRVLVRFARFKLPTRRATARTRSAWPGGDPAPARRAHRISARARGRARRARARRRVVGLRVRLGPHVRPALAAHHRRAPGHDLQPVGADGVGVGRVHPGSGHLRLVLDPRPATTRAPRPW